jgi:hypothetical protein
MSDSEAGVRGLSTDEDGAVGFNGAVAYARLPSPSQRTSQPRGVSDGPVQHVGLKHWDVAPRGACLQNTHEDNTIKPVCQRNRDGELDSIAAPSLGRQGELNETNKRLTEQYRSVRPREHFNVRSRSQGELSDYKCMTIFFIEMQSLLLRLTLHEVRGDFLNGMVIDVEDLGMVLFTLDQLKSLFFPAFSSGSFIRELAAETVMEHVNLLWKKDSQIFSIPSSGITTDEQSYATWRELLERLMSSTYWATSSFQMKHSVTLIPSEGVQVKEEDHLGKQRGQRGLSKDWKPTTRLSAQHDKKYAKTRTRVSAEPRLALEEIVIDSSDGSDDDESNFSFGSQPSDSAMRYRVVTPPRFELEGSQTLRKYLESFERYFQRKYNGTQLECSIELAKFLDGETLAAYKSCGGTEKRYAIVKERLLEWFKTRHVHGAKRWRNELRMMRMDQGESFKMFGMRVMETAQKAYTHDTKECARKMLDKYSQATPEWFNDKLRQRSDMKEMMGLGKKLNWQDVMNQAEKEDKNVLDKKWKMKIADGYDIPETGVLITRGAVPVTSQEYQKEQPGPRAHSFKWREPLQKLTANKERHVTEQPEKYGSYDHCDWCGKPRHSSQNCWRKMGACLICGGRDHLLRDCPNYGKGFRLFTPKCPECNGAHLGIHCSRQDQRNLN